MVSRASAVISGRRQATLLSSGLTAHLTAVLPGVVAVGLMLIWAEHDGGYDQDTWYWGALVLLAVLATCAVRLQGRSKALRLSRAAKSAIALFALYVLWSYASIAWAQAPGTALDGSNRALLYLIIFCLFAILPWTTAGALTLITTWATGVGLIALVTMVRLTGADQLSAIFLGGRLIATTGYFNSSVALFTMGALVATALSLRRELPVPIRALLIACACIEMQLAFMGQSRGWLFTLPLVLVVTLLLVRERIRFVLAALLPAVATLVPIHVLLDVYDSAGTAAFAHAAKRAGHAGLLTFAVAFVIGSALAWGETRVHAQRISPRATRAVGVALAVLALAAGAGGALAATHGHPVQFVKRQLNGFTHEDSGGTGSHFATVGSGRYDFWRVAFKAFLTHPVGGLGQDNFENYYVVHRRTYEEPAWPHSLEMRLLACTGIVGFLLFLGFLVCALRGAVRALRSPPARGTLGPAVCAAALLPLVVWLLHGSVDWFWEIPALSAPALGFLAMALAFDRPQGPDTPAVGAADTGSSPQKRRRGPRARPWLAAGAAAIALIAATIALGFPYLSVREVSEASNVQSSAPGAALHFLKLAADLDPLSATPGQMGGEIALVNGLWIQAQQRYQQAVDRDPGAWMSWFGDGLADSALGQNLAATRALRRAASINRQQPVIQLALARVDTTHPLQPAQALSMITPP